VFIDLGQLGAADSAMPIRRGQLDPANSASGHFGAASHAVGLQGQLASGHEKGSSTPIRIPAGAFRTVPAGGTSRTRQRDTVRPEPKLGFFGTVQKVTYIDGTLRIAPRLFSQVLVLLAVEHGGVHPVIYGLLPNKTAMIYQRFLDMILGLRADMNPDSISRDYKIALFNTVSAGFPNA